MKLFISHSQQDRPFILPMVEMLYSIGMSENDIFCSSIPEPGIPGRKEIYEYLRELFVKEELYVLFMLSDRYYQSVNAFLGCHDLTLSCCHEIARISVMECSL